MVEDNGFPNGGQLLDCQCMEQDAVSSDPIRLLDLRGMGASQTSGRLPAGIAGHEPRCDPHKELRLLQVVGTGEGLLRKGPAAGVAPEPRDRPAIAPPAIRTVPNRPEGGS